MSTFTRGLIVMDKRSSLFFLKTELHRTSQKNADIELEALLNHSEAEL